MKRAALETAPPFFLRLDGTLGCERIGRGCLGAAVTKSDKVLGALTAVALSLFVVVQARAMMIDLGAAMHDAYCQDH